MLMYFFAGFLLSHPVYDQTQGSGAVFFFSFLTLLITLVAHVTKGYHQSNSLVLRGLWSCPVLSRVI